jgi:hypothetical protein
MLQIEDSYRGLAELNAAKGIRSVLICDRGAMDPSAYMDREDWLRMLQEMELEEISLRDHRYDVIIHLVTAAKGAEPFYTLQNNATRTEGIETAIKVDKAVMNAWVGHASLQVIDNESVSNFNDKCDQVVRAVSTRLGLYEHFTEGVSPPRPLARTITKKKFLISNYDPDAPFPVEYRQFIVQRNQSNLISDMYLANTIENKQTRIRR